jgi:plastocyanin
MWGVVVFVTLYVLAVALLAPALLFAAGDQTVQSKQTVPSQATTTSPVPAGAEAAAPAGAPPTPAQAPAISASPPPPAAAKARLPVRAAPRARAAAADTIADFAFSPATITVTAGESVTWHNDGPSQHSATADDQSFDTGVLGKGADGSHTFHQAGTFSYFCKVHPNMKGTVKVLAASSSGANNGGSSSNSTNGSNGTSSGSGSRLPSTGLDIALLALLGIGLLCCGAGLRLRLAERYSPSSRR